MRQVFLCKRQAILAELLPQPRSKYRLTSSQLFFNFRPREIKTLARFHRDLFVRIYSGEWLIHWNASVSRAIYRGSRLKFFPLVSLVSSCVCVCVCHLFEELKEVARSHGGFMPTGIRKTSPRVPQSRSYKNFLYRALSGTWERDTRITVL